MRKYLTLFASLFVIALLSGCGDPKVKGKVTFSDGSPLTKGQVMFQKEGFIGSGDIKKDGSYSAGKQKDGDGLPPGTYQVFISGASTYDQAELKDAQKQDVVIGAGQLGKIPKPFDLIHSKFTSPKTSGLSVEVKGGSVKYDITVEPPQ